jgi:hypothetical protein
MDYAKIIADGYNYAIHKQECRMLLTAHFRREAMKAKEQHYEYEEFFYGCKDIIEALSASIEGQLKRQEHEFKRMINHLYMGNVTDGNTGELLTTEKRDESIAQLREQINGLSPDVYTAQLTVYPQIRFTSCDLELLMTAILSVEKQLTENKATEPANTDIPKQQKISNIAAPEKPQRQINQDGINKLFSPFLFIPETGKKQTKGERLLSSLRIDRTTTKEYARIALIMHDSKYVETGDEFSKWLNNFYNLMDIKERTNYKPKDLQTGTKHLKKEFDYLL